MSRKTDLEAVIETLEDLIRHLRPMTEPQVEDEPSLSDAVCRFADAIGYCGKLSDKLQALSVIARDRPPVPSDAAFQDALALRGQLNLAVDDALDISNVVRLRREASES